VLQLYQQEKEERLIEKLKRECGTYFLEALKDPKITEIMLNPDGHLWIDHVDNGLTDTGLILSEIHSFNLISTVASLQGALINENHEVLETEFPLDGSRFEAVIQQIVEAPSFSLRKKAIRVFTLSEYIQKEIITSLQANSLRNAILNRQSILIVGGPGTGKTTLANAILDEMVKLGDPSQRFVIIEDTRELQCNAKNTLFLKTTSRVNFQQLLRVALRSRPDKICMGECRGAEMLTLLKAWNTGTPGGIATIHANSAKAALIRISEMIAESGSVPLPRLICEAVNIIVALEFHPEKGRIVNDILRVVGFDGEQYQFESLVSINTHKE